MVWMLSTLSRRKINRGLEGVRKKSCPGFDPDSPIATSDTLFLLLIMNRFFLYHEYQLIRHVRHITSVV